MIKETKNILPPQYVAKGIDPNRPPWSARGEREREFMRAWVNQQLNEISFEVFTHKQRTFFLREDGGIDVEKYFARSKVYGWEVEEAEHGNIEPLRDRLKAFNPRVAKFINLPILKEERGKKWPKVRWDANKRLAAVEDVRRIRAIWKQHYQKKEPAQR